MSDRCPNCGKPCYAAEGVPLFGHRWHKICLKCAHCGKMLSPGDAHEHDSRPYCKQCHAGRFGPSGYGFSKTLGQASSAAVAAAAPPPAAAGPAAPTAPARGRGWGGVPSSAPSAHRQAPRWDAPADAPPPADPMRRNGGPGLVAGGGDSGRSRAVTSPPRPQQQAGPGMGGRVRAFTKGSGDKLKKLFNRGGGGGGGGRGGGRAAAAASPAGSGLKGTICTPMAAPGTMMAVKCPQCNGLMHIVAGSERTPRCQFECPQCHALFGL